MEVILVTDKPLYKALISANKMLFFHYARVQASAVDMASIIDTEVFLNHHYDICFYFFKDNFPFQMHMLNKAAKQFLDRSESPIDIKINERRSIEISSQNDLTQIFPNIQQALQDPIFDAQTNVSKSTFQFLFQDVHIQFIIINDLQPQQGKLRDAVNSNCRKNAGSLQKQSKLLTEEKTNGNWKNDYETTGQNSGDNRVFKAVILINDENYEQFLNWNESETDSARQVNKKLSQQYLSLRQEIQNQKNSFKNKIKMVEALIGENINVERLLTEQKDENSQLKKLKDTYEAIKNIDLVLMDQQKKIEDLQAQLKEKRAFKQKTLQEKAQGYMRLGKQIKDMEIGIQQMQESIKNLEKNKSEFLAARSFEPSSQVNQLLEGYVQKIKDSTSLKMNSLGNKNARVFSSLHNNLSLLQLSKNGLASSVSKTDNSQNQSDTTKKIRIEKQTILGDLLPRNNHLNSRISKVEDSIKNTSSNNNTTILSNNTNSNRTYAKTPRIPEFQVYLPNKTQKQSISTIKRGLHNKMRNSLHENAKIIKQKYRQIMFSRTTSVFSKQPDEKIQKQTQSQGYQEQSSRIKEQLFEHEKLLLEMADYYHKNSILSAQIKKRNQINNFSESKRNSKTNFSSILSQDHPECQIPFPSSQNQEEGNRVLSRILQLAQRKQTFYVLVQLLQNEGFRKKIPIERKNFHEIKQNFSFHQSTSASMSYSQNKPQQNIFEDRFMDRQNKIKFSIKTKNCKKTQLNQYR